MSSDGWPIRFGVNFLPNHAMEALDWVKVAEETGFAIAGIADSQSLYRDVYVVEALVAANTRTIRFGSRVINPMTRHPAVAASAAASIEELAPGRTMIGIGTGDSSVDNIGVRPAKHAELIAYVNTVRELLQTGESVYNGGNCKLTWFRGRIPIYLAASGPKTLQLAGEIADGVIINTGLTPEIVRDSIAQVKAGCGRAGRSLADVDMWWLPLTNVGADRKKAIDEIAMTLASAGSHLSRFTVEGKHIPEHLMEKVKMLGARYNSAQHDKPDSSNRELIKELGLLDYLAERFAIAGTPRDCIAKLEAAIGAGARQFWMSIHFDDKAGFMRDWARDIMPAFR
ncbi:MAG TPA: LLM class flavin-dependent oxidoreductase [Xanthobacteraceae bacterium]|jgi:5,10-methylenetetrahydromethanopterin reductase